ncbi:DUF3574 domain-containing protein [Vibrio vulnificus]|uniref:DUF3574 domain-containing protein n=1 Tax=Vibrio vulnificus TaxID=672 RepID=UPI001CDD81F1|nr:DUF3574 domain-containing protein [Vibrio vulnificus]MCA3903603.1 DUF3574 domain-containing protein [Vibrio vulnificus]
MKFYLIKLLTLSVCLMAPFSTFASGSYSYKLYFGLSKPGGGAVSSKEWEQFQNETITKYFDGFNVADTVGFYKGESETSKVVTIISNQPELYNIRSLAKEYNSKFKQESVMMIQQELYDFEFISN